MLTVGWMREFNVTFAYVKPHRQAGTMVMRWVALAARMKPPSNMTAPGFNPGPDVRCPECLPLSYGQMAHAL